MDKRVAGYAAAIVAVSFVASCATGNERQDYAAEGGSVAHIVER